LFDGIRQRRFLRGLAFGDERFEGRCGDGSHAHHDGVAMIRRCAVATAQNHKMPDLLKDALLGIGSGSPRELRDRALLLVGFY
jgi:hypothetical protein